MKFNLRRLVAVTLPLFGLLYVGRGVSDDRARTETLAAKQRHWAFVPPGIPAVPDIGDESWPKSPIDRFILAGLEARSLRPAPPADKRTLIRRATFDLTGLPPTPEEIDAFLADASPDAFARLVDRLLGSPAYGERWGRHWLDVARYADSNGLDENVAHGNAWRYRDYVIASFNADKPFDQFLVEQIAGDLLPAADRDTRHERLIATGFLSLGPKVLAEPDEKKMEMDIVDEQVDTVGRAVMGLTLGCARCHDHKFDPVSMEDYYGLVGVFRSTRTMETFKKVARWHEHILANPDQLAGKAYHDRRVAEVKAELKSRAIAPALAQKKRTTLAELEKSAPELPSAMGVAEAKVADAAVLRRGNPLTPGEVVARRVPAILAGDAQPPFPAEQSGRLELARWLTRPDHPLTSRVLVNRVWRWHFGHGLVRSPDNFGLLGEPPSHPELLDWLARRFVADGWSIKTLHRLIMLSAAYQMSATRDPHAAEIDPENRLIWRTNVRRLEAEEIRDALLSVSGLLDRTAGGPAITHVKNRAFLFDHTSKDETTYGSRRRSVYLPVIRNHLYDVFQLFDSTDAAVSNGDRATTTVPTQALFALNSDLMIDASERLAARLLEPPDLDDAGRVRVLYLTAYGRPATAAETDRARAAIGRFEAELQTAEREPRRTQAWALFCHVILAANEFVFLN